MKFLGKEKKQPEKTPRLGKGLIPTEKVKDLSGKGFSEPEIIDVLRRDGYSSEEIESALTQALKLGVSGETEDSVSRPPTLQELQQSSNFQTPMAQENSQIPQMPEQSMQFQQTYYTANDDYDTEELVESLVQERMGELDNKLTEFRTKYGDLERKMANLHNQLTVMSKSKNEAENSIISKLDSYGDTLSALNAKLSSFEKAFKEALPALIESVRSLTDLVGRFKREA